MADPFSLLPLSIAAHGGRNRFRTVKVAGTEYRVLTTALPGGGAAQIGRAIPWLVAGPGPDVAETPEQLVRIDRTGIDGDRHGSKVLAGDGCDLIGDRRR